MDDDLHAAITFYGGEDPPMLTITKDAFYVRGVKVAQGPSEARDVYNAVLAVCRHHFEGPSEVGEMEGR